MTARRAAVSGDMVRASSIRCETVYGAARRRSGRRRSRWGRLTSDAGASEFGRSGDSAADRRAPDDPLAPQLAAALHGDEAAFAEIYRAVQPPLLRYLRVLVRDDAEDVAAETWAQAVRDLDSFSGDVAGFRAWVATIGRHRALDHLRARGRRPADPVPTETLTGRPAADDTALAAAEAISTERALRLIATLPPDQAEAVLLRVVVGLDARSAGRVMGKRPGAVRTASYRGLRTLSERLSGSAGTAGADRPTGPDR